MAYRSLFVILMGLVLAGYSMANDWLIDGSEYKAKVVFDEAEGVLVLGNGLISRTWVVKPDLACVSFLNLMSGEEMLRSVRPEARVTVDGIHHKVGGLDGQVNHAFLTREWVQGLERSEGSLDFVGYEVGVPVERFGWGRRRHHAPGAVWPPKGVGLRLDFKGNGLSVSVHYELYDGVPVLSKWITVKNEGEKMVVLDRFMGEELAAVEQASWVETRMGAALPTPDYLHVETDMAFGGDVPEIANRKAVKWVTDPTYTSQVNYQLETPCLLQVQPERGPDQDLEPGEVFEGFRVFELVYDRGDRERRSLALRRFYRTVAPWVTENPLTHHLLSSDPERVKAAIDEAKAVGFEAIILSFGSGFNVENEDPGYRAKWKAVADYAEEVGVELGTYSLFSSRTIGGGNDIVSPEGEAPTHGNCPAATSEWGQWYYANLRAFFEATGFDQFENDGPYPGDTDVMERLPLQKGVNDSQWVQWRIVSDLYKEFRAAGIYINAPDYYFLSGSNKCGMGYREVNWSLPRAQQVIHTRQNIYDGTWTKTPSMGWMHVPLAEYHGGGAEATIEPLKDHLEHYKSMMLSNMAFGVQGHYRGPRLFDAPETREMVKGVVDWFKAYREILESDVIHGRRADGRRLDWMMHVNPGGEIKGMVCVFNPTRETLREKIRLDLYYTGLTSEVRVAMEDKDEKKVGVGRDYEIEIDMEVPAQGMRWVVLR